MDQPPGAVHATGRFDAPSDQAHEPEKRPSLRQLVEAACFDDTPRSRRQLQVGAA
jgi:hypothetical protein|eukprot:COSAG06_NODE_4771_length_3966_cov_2.491337_4_plen_55_part_00